MPIYSRVTHDAPLSDGLGEALVGCLSNFGVPWIDADSSYPTAFAKRLVAIGSYQPIDCEKFKNASAIQFQLYGASFDLAPSHKKVHWKPGLPVELYTIEQLAKKVEAVRCMGPTSLPIGAAIVANEATIYEDVRYLMDSGFDWIELIQSACYDLTATSHLVFGEMQSCVTRAMKARSDAKRNCPIWLCGNFVSVKEWSHWLSLGIHACCLDGYLASRRPVNHVPRDTLAGIRVQTSPNSQFEWLSEVMRELRHSLIDELGFRGWD